jgi:sialidase-1
MKIIFLVYFFLTGMHLHAQKENIVFESGKEGYAIFRIPSIIILPSKKILAFAEGRLNGGADFGNIKIVMKSSTDLGKTWSSINQVVTYGNLQAGNAAPVVDLFDPLYPQGKIYLFYNTGNVSESELRKGRGIREVWFISSVDEGFTWSAPENITNQVHYPNGKMDNRAYQNKEDWRTYANTPGHATQCINGIYKGRIYIAANHSQGDPQKSYLDYASHGYYSDDHCKTFHLSSSLNLKGSNEATAAFLSNGRLLLNARNQKGDVKSRITAISKNGGESFDTIYFDNKLPDPICEGALLNVGIKNKKSVLAFVNAADTIDRNNLTLKISFDEGFSWPIHKLIDGISNSAKQHQDYTAYSDLVKTGKREIGVLYEKDNYSKIVYKSIHW